VHRFPLALLFGSSLATADDHVALGYLVSPPIAASGSGPVHAVAGRWDREITSSFEVGIGIELGASGGEQPLTRAAILPGAAIDMFRFGTMTVRLEEQIGWQIVQGRLSLGGLPLRGTEPRGFHQEAALAVDIELNATVDLRVRAGVVVDGIFPAGHRSVEVGPFFGVSAVVRP
jgi:hypothetical protein